MKNIAKKMMGLAALAVLTLGGVTEVKAADTSDFHFNSGVRYSQWVTNSRIGNYYANTTANGFAKYNAEGTLISGRTDGKSKLDYVPGLVAKAVIENVQYYSQYQWAQSWALPFFYSIADYGNAFYDQYASTYGSLDDLNASKVFFGLYDLTNTGGAYASNNVVTSASTTKSHAQEALRWAMEGENGTGGIKKHNSTYYIRDTTSAYNAGHTIVQGGWYHKSSYKNEMWLDGSYMGPALFAQLKNYNGGNIISSDDWTIVYNQMQALWEMCWNSSDKLLYHAFAAASHSNYSATWSGFNPAGGVYHSASYWGRACGWYFLALVDILEQMDKAGLTGTDNYNTLKGHLADLCAGLAARQDATSGCWYQILDEDGTFHSSTYNNGKNASKHSDTYNYIESSASALFTAGYLKAIRLDYISSATYEPVAKKAYAGLVNNFFAADGNEGVHLFGSCRSAGLGGAAVNGDKWRDGSKAYYLLGHDVARVAKSENVTEGKILGAFILAATEYERLYQDNTVLFEKDLAPSYELEAGDEISCPATGSGANITYQWYKDGVAVGGATNATIAPDASGSYYCKATSGTTTIQSSTANVSVSGETPAETTYTVTFDATTNGGTCGTASLTQASAGASITLPTATKSGYTFNGWYTASTGGTLKGAANAAYTPTANETLYAQFTENSGTGESETNAPATVSYGTGGAAKTFLDVANTKSNTTIASNSAKCVTFGLYELHKNWKPAWANEITNGSSSSANYTNASDYGFLTGSGSGSGTSANKSATSGYGLIKYTDSAIGIFYVTGVTGIAVMGKDNNTSNEKRLYIKVEEYGTDGTLTAVGGSDGITKSSYNTSLHITEYTAGTLEGTKYYKVSLYSGSSNNEETSQIRFTKYEGGGDTPTPTTYTVSYNMNGHGTAIDAVEGVTALPSTLPTPEATGYTFGGWYTDSGLNNAATAGASISADTELYAKWTEKAAATVSISPTSGNVTVGSTLDISSYVTAGSSTGAIGYSTGDATKATVTSAGVITGVAEGSATIYVTQQEDANYKTGSVTFTVTVTAAPVPVKNYTVKFYNGETQFGDSQTIEEGATVSAPTTNPTKEGYTFKGWALESGSTVRVTFPYPIYEDVNFYAVWSNSTSGGSGGNFTATATATLSVAADASNTEITSTNATISGGKMYVSNGQTSAKKLIDQKGEYAFTMTNNNTFFKVTLDKALVAGDKIKAEIFGPKINSNNESQPRGLWMSTATSRPSSATATLSVTNTSTSSDAWLTSEDYTVTTGDGICGETTFYIYRATANSTYFTDFTITTSSTGDDTNITLETVSDYDNFESYAGDGKTVTFKRNFNNGKWTTLVLPFSARTDQVIAAFEYPNDCEFANIQSMTVTAQGTGSISYVTTSHITANTPILAKIKPNDGLSGKDGFTANEYVFSGVKVVNPANASAIAATSTDGNVTMYGVYKNTARADIDNNSYFLSGGKFYDWSWLSNMTPFTAYIVPQTTSGNTLKGLTFEEDNATGINETLRYENETLRYENSFNLAGQKVGKGYKGMVISKGRKIIDN